MTGRVLEMKKTHIVYTFYQGDKENQTFFLTSKITSVPTIIIFNGGKEVRRHVGIVPADRITAGVKTKKEQKESWYPDWLKLW